jgi:2-(1,2-epoxy-1,2-dihydrophenyl)acetyl-CoA isomerase
VSKLVTTGTPDLIATVEDGVGTLTMNRPERRNAMSEAMMQAMGQVLAAWEADPEIGCVVLTGAGSAFCAGGDVKDMVERTAQETEQRIRALRINQHATAGRLHRMPKPTIAALPGAAAGAGLSLALACDLRIAADGAVLSTAFAQVGLAGDFGGSYFLTQLVGVAKAKELYFLCGRITAAEALALGIVNWVVPSELLARRTGAVAAQLAAGPRVAFGYMKENIQRATHAGLDECLDLEATFFAVTRATEDHRESARAFVEKRPAAFRGR